ncbi:MAG: iron-containing alcohol dehydrogenase [Candidatus Methanomethyliaceae archaeon]|nr:iron-containing alcohol dehydrogenase [Candidatus Methanomethyliaceae archaeon]MDW7971261.1 iron-containing alcohol dehydrogenase [Nitrososphaerota archaeon]
MYKFYHPLFRTYTFLSPTRVIFGPNSLEKLSDELKKFDLKSVLIVSGKNVCKTEGYKRVCELLPSPIEFNEVLPEPDESVLQNLTSKVREINPSLIIGVGGGSSLDMAKIASIVAVNKKDPILYFKGEPIQNRGPPIITIPTLTGTGAEVTPISVIIHEGKKLALYNSFLYPTLSIVDPILSISAPPDITASAGIDALSHALESIMSIDSSIMTEPLALEAIRLSNDHLERVYCNGEDIEARSAMAIASILAGISFMNTGLCLPHGIAYTYAVKYKLSHGISVAIPQPYVIEFNAPSITNKLHLIASALGLDVTGASPYETSNIISSRIIEIMEFLKIPTDLSSIGIKESEIDIMVEDLINNYSRFITKNPRKPSREDLFNLFQQMFQESWESGEV